MKHVFAVCAYGESRYLEECVLSLVNQSEKDRCIIICTSTPNGHIERISKKYGLELFVRQGEPGLKDDWNFAAETAVNVKGADAVTLAHQDDIYHRDYLKAVKRSAEKYPDMVLFCTAYRTIDENGRKADSKTEKVKHILRLPIRFRKFADNGLLKRLSLILGNSICCPSCTYMINRTGLPLFDNDYSFVIDWETLLRLSRIKGRFVCISRKLVDYRVHSGAETKKNIDNHVREEEEKQIFSKLWGRPIAALLMHFYKKAYSAYD